MLINSPIMSLCLLVKPPILRTSGAGHHSPIGAYDEETIVYLFLMLQGSTWEYHGTIIELDISWDMFDGYNIDLLIQDHSILDVSGLSNVQQTSCWWIHYIMCIYIYIYIYNILSIYTYIYIYICVYYIYILCMNIYLLMIVIHEAWAGEFCSQPVTWMCLLWWAL